MTHTHTKTYTVVSSHFWRRLARLKKKRLDTLTEQAHGGRSRRSETLQEYNARHAAWKRLEDLGLPVSGTYEVRKSLRGPYRWQVIVWS